MAAPKLYKVYMIECTNGRIYTGIAIDPIKRFLQHESGRGAKYFRMNKPKRLMYKSSPMSKSDALKLEAAYKKLTHKEKVWLVNAIERGIP